MGKAQPDTAAVAAAAPKVVTPLEIQQKEFRVSRFGGYRMRDVDEFLDQITEAVGAMISENDRLRRQLGAAPVVGSPDLDDVSRQADEIIQRARDEAARVVAEARERAASMAGSSAAGGIDAASETERAAVDAFLTQERDFLQSLAALVQGHAESVKGMARKARAKSPVSEPEGPSDRERSAPGSEAPSPADDGADAQAALEKAPAVEPGPVGEGSDLRRGPDEAATIRLSEAERPAAVPGERSEERADGSLRDLFWGGEDGD
jgi:DivIVA domain-containing protein